MKEKIKHIAICNEAITIVTKDDRIFICRGNDVDAGWFELPRPPIFDEKEKINGKATEKSEKIARKIIKKKKIKTKKTTPKKRSIKKKN